MRIRYGYWGYKKPYLYIYNGRQLSWWGFEISLWGYYIYVEVPKRRVKK